MQFAFALEWVPSTIIDPHKADLLLAVVEEMRNDPLPSDFTFATEDLPELLANEPGRGMLELTQNLRNYVHPTRWLRLQEKLEPQSFTLWCEIATKLSSELRDSLMLTAFKLQTKKVADARGGLRQILDGTEADKQLFKRLVSEQLTQRTGIAIPLNIDLQDLLDGLHKAFLSAEMETPEQHQSDAS